MSASAEQKCKAVSDILYLPRVSNSNKISAIRALIVGQVEPSKVIHILKNLDQNPGGLRTLCRELGFEELP